MEGFEEFVKTVFKAIILITLFGFVVATIILYEKNKELQKNYDSVRIELNVYKSLINE